jgi:glycosyltransferase involved in cell wall biosynthesis
MSGLRDSNTLILYNFNPNTPAFDKNKFRRQYFLYLGRLSYEKGLVTLIKAFTKLKDLRLKIVGTGPLEDFLKSLVKETGSNNIEFAGFKSGNELKTIVSEASFNIVPSEWWENNPMSMIESYSAGIPVIGANVGGIPEIIDEDKTGFLFEMKNADRLAEAVVKADILSEEEYITMSNNVVKFAIAKFSKEQYVNVLVDFYEKMIQKIKK